jgi:flagellar biosynthesis/type III secretory pathway protein FliH
VTSSSRGHARWDPPDFESTGSGRASAGGSSAALADGEWNPPELDQSGGRPLPGLDAAKRTEQDDSYDRGYADGLRDARAQMEQRTRSAVETLAQAVDGLAASRAGFTRDLLGNIHALALAAAKKVIQRELQTDPTIVRDLVTRALELLDMTSPIEIRLHPEDLEAFRGDWEGLAPPDRQRDVQWLADPSLERGSFLIESPTRIIDGRTDVALRNLYERLGLD